MTLPDQAPPQWGNDPLTKFFDDARGNQYATFFNKRAPFNRLVAIDKAVDDLFNGSKNIDPWFPATVMLRAHSSFRAAVSLVASGQVYETATMLRLCIETAAYSLYIGSDLTRAECWLRRSDSEQHKAATRAMFTHKRVLAQIVKANQTLGSFYSELYEHAIDHGAHPNEAGYMRSMRISELPEGKRFESVQLHADERLIGITIEKVEKAGIFLLCAARILWPIRSDLGGLTETLLKLDQAAYRSTFRDAT
ncbi:hypothetical protein LH464_05150 [Neorhizobium sp. T786]|uniref:DUF5677 domain-containing protein n=1 Tax=Pseudorhizobium xiangyangii TaxID=2883104 RepID=UPI001CFF7EFA|nr:DUF5677 domain-containing protein [Neorhizobium xiangyangii]MCB5201864.1 hypothetical protein [Neorhizobium xiangyangii]